MKRPTKKEIEIHMELILRLYEVDVPKRNEKKKEEAKGETK